MEIGGDIHPEERTMVQRVYDICDSQINTSGAVPQIKQKQRSNGEESLRNLKRP